MMRCPKCNSEMTAQVVSEKKRRSVLMVLLYIILLFLPVIGWIALAMLLRGRKSVPVTYMVCSKCGYTVKADAKKIDVMNTTDNPEKIGA